MTDDRYVDLTAPIDQVAIDAEREARRLAAALVLAPSITAARALIAGRSVPVELLDPEIVALLPLWGGFLDDAAVLDVEVAIESRRAGATSAKPKGGTCPPAHVEPARSLADYGVLPLDDVKPAKRRR